MLRVRSQIEFRVALMNKRAPPICAAAEKGVADQKKNHIRGGAEAWLGALGGPNPDLRVIPDPLK